jgi:hypothetical protein
MAAHRARFIADADQQLQRWQRSRRKGEDAAQPCRAFRGATGLMAQYAHIVQKFRVGRRGAE